jgi:hypothetical protein
VPEAVIRRVRKLSSQVPTPPASSPSSSADRATPAASSRARNSAAASRTIPDDRMNTPTETWSDTECTAKLIRGVSHRKAAARTPISAAAPPAQGPQSSPASAIAG